MKGGGYITNTLQNTIPYNRSHNSSEAKMGLQGRNFYNIKFDNHKVILDPMTSLNDFSLNQTKYKENYTQKSSNIL